MWTMVSGEPHYFLAQSGLIRYAYTVCAYGAACVGGCTLCAHGCAMRRAVCAYSCAMRRAVCAACAYSFSSIFATIFVQILLYHPLRNAALRDGMCGVSMSLLCTVF